MVAPLKFNHDVVVPKGRIPELFALVDRIKTRVPAADSRRFGHAGDGNIHVNIMVDAGDADEIARAHEAEGVLFEGVVALEGSISGEHGIGFAKAKFLPLELSADEIALMKRVKDAFDPEGHPEPRQNLPLTHLVDIAPAHVPEGSVHRAARPGVALRRRNPRPTRLLRSRQVQKLKAQQASMQRDLEAIKSILQQAQAAGRRSVREQDRHGHHEPTRGNASAKITLVEVSDYHCPFCRRQMLQTMPSC